MTSALPVRLAGVRRFFLDRDELTVGRYRDALARGLERRGDELTVVPNDEALADAAGRRATFSRKPMGRERHPLNQITWAHARAVCQFLGGDLPTEAQWEYASSAAGSVVRRSYPWGEDEPSCARAVVQRVPYAGSRLPACPGTSPIEPVDSARAMADVNLLGIRGLAGSLSEMTRDGAWAYDDACLASRGAVEAWCDDPEAPLRIARGGSWMLPFFFTRAAVRSPRPTLPASDVGFRCAYPARPRSR